VRRLLPTGFWPHCIVRLTAHPAAAILFPSLARQPGIHAASQSTSQPSAHLDVEALGVHAARHVQVHQVRRLVVRGLQQACKAAGWDHLKDRQIGAKDSTAAANAARWPPDGEVSAGTAAALAAKAGAASQGDPRRTCASYDRWASTSVDTCKVFHGTAGCVNSSAGQRALPAAVKAA